MDPYAPTQADLDSYNDLLSRVSSDGLTAGVDMALANHNAQEGATQIADRAHYMHYVMISAIDSWITQYAPPSGGPL